MSIFGRFKDIMASNVNAMFDSWEDPVKMTDQYLRNLARDVGEVRNATAGVMAAETAARRRVEEQQKQIDRFTLAATNAAKEGNVDNARILLAKKNELQSDLVEMEEQLAVASKNAKEVREVHDKMVADMQTLQKRKANIAANAAIAKAQETAAGVGKRRGRNSESAAAAFERLENKTKERRDKAAAITQLSAPKECDASALLTQYSGGGGFAVESELEALMASVGKPIAKEESVDCEIQALIDAAGGSDEE